MSKMVAVCETATLLIPTSFEPRRDAEDLHMALGKKPDEAIISNILGHRSAQMRLAIRRAYADAYNEDLLTTVYNSKLSADYQELVISLLIGPIGLLARELRKKFDKESADDIICTANGWELREIQAAYEALTSTEEFKKDIKNTTLEAAVNGKIKDKDHKDYLIRLLKGSRDEIPLSTIRDELDARGDCERLIKMDAVNSDVRELYEAAEVKSGKANEEVFLRILSTRSNIHLKKVYDVFLNNYSITLVDFISKKIKSDVKNAYNTSIMAAVDQKLLLVAQLYTSMVGIGTKENQLNRIICLRSEHDLELLKILYEERIGKKLSETIASETSGDYRALLMILLNSEISKK